MGQRWVWVGAIALIVTASAPLKAEEGTTVVLNGQNWSARWVQRMVNGQPRLYVEESWLQGALGMTFLDSPQPQQQRLSWFSMPFFAPVTFDQPVRSRFVDLTALAQTLDLPWRTELGGSTLRVTLPKAQIAAIRHGQQDRVVLELSQRAAWQIAQEGEQVVLRVEAEVAPSLKFPGVAGTLLRSMTLRSQPGSSRFDLTIAPTAQLGVELLGDPARLVVSVQPQALPRSRSVVWAEGIQHQQHPLTLPGGTTFWVNALTVDMKRSGIRMRPLWGAGQGVVGTQPLATFRQQWPAAALINGGFFNRDRRLPVGALRSEGQWYAGTALNRGAIAWDDTGAILIDRFTYTEELVLTSGQVFPLTNLNSGYVQRGIARYTPTWGPVYSPLTDSELVLTVVGDRVVSQQISPTAGAVQVPIPSNGYLLVARQVPDAATLLPIGTAVSGRYTYRPSSFAPFPHLLGAGPLLMRRGVVVLDPAGEGFSPAFATQRARRSAIATTANPGELLWVTIEPLHQGTAPTLSETIAALKMLGAVDALNLDGGSSTAMILGGKTLHHSKQTSNVHSALGLFVSP
jgi:hypothetical protein